MNTTTLLGLVLLITPVGVHAMGRLPSDPATYGDVQGLQTQINNNTASQAQRDTAQNDRLDGLEKVKGFVQTDLRLYDGKRVQWELFNMYDVVNTQEFGAGVKLTLKLGTSYEEKQIQELKRQLEALKALRP